VIFVAKVKMPWQGWALADRPNNRKHTKAVKKYKRRAAPAGRRLKSGMGLNICSNVMRID
jgi:hypothetical protein